jgi:hypothetical protein
MTVRCEPPHLKGTGPLRTLTFARDEGLNPDVGSVQAAPGDPNRASLSRFTDAPVPKSGFRPPG